MKEINLFDLPEEIRIDLNNFYRKKLFRLAVRKVGSIKNLAVLLKTKSKNIQRWRNGKRLFTLNTLNKLVSLTDANLRLIEKNVLHLKIKHGYIKNPKLPIKISKEVGTILGGLLGDGGIGSDYSVHYSNSYPQMVDTFINSVESVFGDVQFSKNKKKDGVISVFFTSILGKILVKNFDVPRGDKTLIDYPIPKIIVNGDVRIVKNFLQRLFDDEGCVNRSLKGIVFYTTIEKNKAEDLRPKRLIQLRELLQRFGINCGEPTKSAERTHISKESKLSLPVEDWRLIIYNKKNLRIFAKKIGFYLEYKMKRLLDTINSIKLEVSPKYTSFNYFIENALNLEKNIKRPFTSRELASASKRKRSRTYYVIEKLKEYGIFEEIIPKNQTSKGYTPSYFILNRNKLNHVVDGENNNETQ